MVDYMAIAKYYTIPSDNRELQRFRRTPGAIFNYTIPSDNRELQHDYLVDANKQDYTIPSDNRELQPGLQFPNDT